MTQEAYVSFETAKLLKEKGFDEPCHYFYKPDSSDLYYGTEQINSQIGRFYNAPTQQMAMRWLREVHKIYIDISPTYSEVEKTIHFIWQIFDSNYDDIGDCEIFYSKYEKAVEDAIKYCLEHLIK